MKKLFLSILVLGAYFAHAQAPTIESGLVALENDQFNKAKGIFMSLLNSNPETSGQAYYYLASAYYQSGKSDSGQMIINKATSLLPQNPYIKVAAGREALNAKNPVDAKANFDAAIQSTKGKDAKVFALIGDAFLNSAMPDRAAAITFLQQGIIVDKTNTELYLLYGDAKKRMENGGGEAASAYEKAVELKAVARGQTRLGSLYGEARNLETSSAAFDAALVADASYIAANRDKGEMLYTLKKYSLARDEYKTYMETADTTNDNLTRFAYMSFQAKDYESVSSIINILLAKDSTNVTLYRLNGYSFCEKKNYPAALENLQKFFDKADTSKIIYLDYKYYGKALMESKQDSLAEIMIGKAVILDSTECDLYADQGDIYMRLKRYTDAQASYAKKMACANSQGAADYFLLGKSYYFNKQYDISDSLFRKVIELKPASSVGYYWAARSTLYKKENNIDEAIPLYDKYLEIVSVDLTKASKKELAEAYLNKGKNAILKDDKVKAKEFLNKVLEFDAENKEAKDLLSSLAKG